MVGSERTGNYVTLPDICSARKELYTRRKGFNRIRSNFNPGFKHDWLTVAHKHRIRLETITVPFTFPQSATKLDNLKSIHSPIMNDDVAVPFSQVVHLRSLLGAVNKYRKQNPLGGSRIHSKSYDFKQTRKRIPSKPKFESCLDLLSSADIDQNRVGMQRLIMLTRNIGDLRSNRAVGQASLAIVYGGENENSIEEQIRRVFIPFFSDLEVIEEDPSVSPYDGLVSKMDEEAPKGKKGGALHSLALRVIVNALQRISWVAEEGDDYYTPLDLSDPCWRQIVSTLMSNIELNHTAEISAHSMKCLRLLHTLEPATIEPLLCYTLLPYLVHLHGFGKLHRDPLVEFEATRLLKRLQLNVGETE